MNTQSILCCLVLSLLLSAAACANDDPVSDRSSIRDAGVEQDMEEERDLVPDPDDVGEGFDQGLDRGFDGVDEGFDQGVDQGVDVETDEGVDVPAEDLAEDLVEDLPEPDCDDGDVCTDDSYNGDAGVCEHVFNVAPCDDGDACTQGDLCREGVCVVGEEPVDCDDENFCTVDGCNVLAGCFHIPSENLCCLGEVSVCDDGDPCTDDSCDPGTGACSRAFNTASCDDGSACTEADRCEAGRCAGEAVVCDDANVCTEDVCEDARGCVFVSRDGVVCDDGLECSVDDACQAGECVGDEIACVCEPVFGETASKMSGLMLGGGEVAGEAIDVDQDGDLDNSLGALGSVLNGPLGDAVDEGSLILLFDFQGVSSNPFSLVVFNGELAPGDAGCDVQGEVCDYEISESLLDVDSCEPLVSLPATLQGDQLVAGGVGTVFPFSLPIGGADLTLTLYEARLEAEVVREGGQIVAFSGVLGGAVRKEELLEALGALPEDVLPYPLDAIAAILNILVVNDIDVDGDGEPDAASLSIVLRGQGARLVGVRSY